MGTEMAVLYALRSAFASLTELLLQFRRGKRVKPVGNFEDDDHVSRPTADCHLLQLPIEIRTQIYDLVFDPYRINYHCEHGSRGKLRRLHFESFHAALLSCCRQIYKETRWLTPEVTVSLTGRDSKAIRPKIKLSSIPTRFLAATSTMIVNYNLIELIDYQLVARAMPKLRYFELRLEAYTRPLGTRWPAAYGIEMAELAEIEYGVNSLHQFRRYAFITRIGSYLSSHRYGGWEAVRK